MNNQNLFYTPTFNDLCRFVHLSLCLPVHPFICPSVICLFVCWQTLIINVWSIIQGAEFMFGKHIPWTSSFIWHQYWPPCNHDSMIPDDLIQFNVSKNIYNIFSVKLPVMDNMSCDFFYRKATWPKPSNNAYW